MKCRLLFGCLQVTTIKTVKQMEDLVNLGDGAAWHEKWRIKLTTLFHQVINCEMCCCSWSFTPDMTHFLHYRTCNINPGHNWSICGVFSDWGSCLCCAVDNFFVMSYLERRPICRPFIQGCLVLSSFQALFTLNLNSTHRTCWRCNEWVLVDGGFKAEEFLQNHRCRHRRQEHQPGSRR